jgi:hypothetical protein
VIGFRRSIVTLKFFTVQNPAICRLQTMLQVAANEVIE